GGFYAFGWRIYRARRPVLAIWAIVLLASLPLAPRVIRLVQPGGLSSNQFEAARASALLQRELGYNPANIVVVFTSDQLSLDDPRWAEDEQAALADVRRLPDVAEIVTRRESPRYAALDGHATYATIALKSRPEAFRESMPVVRAALRPTEL